MKKFIVKKETKKEYTQFTCRIEDELLKQIRDIVNHNDLSSINSFINDCLKFAIENIEIK